MVEENKMMGESVNYDVLKNADDKELIKQPFQSFFEEVFGKPLSDELWRHQFIHSPYGDTALFIATVGTKIIGSALQIRQKIVIGDKIHDYYLYTTSAILKEYRPRGVYAELLKIQKEYARDNAASFIFAYPNALAHPVLKLFGGFKNVEKITLVKTKLSNVDVVNNAETQGLLMDLPMFNWRFEHRDYKFARQGEAVIVYKEYDGAFDILAIYKQDVFDGITVNFDELDQNAKVIVSQKYVISTQNSEVVEYLNGTFFPFNKEIVASDIHLNLLMSDVF